MRGALLMALAASAACSPTHETQAPAAPRAQAPAAPEAQAPAAPEVQAPAARSPAVPSVTAPLPPVASPAVPPAPAPLAGVELERARTLLDRCRGCHGPEMLAQQRLTAKQWEANVKKMRGWGAVLSDEEAILFVRYLAEMPPGPDAAGTISGAQAAAALAPRPDGRFARGSARKGERLFAATCAGCHGTDARGGQLGVNLTDRPILYRADEFAAVVRGGRGPMMGTPRTTDREIASMLAWLRSLAPLHGRGT